MSSTILVLGTKFLRLFIAWVIGSVIYFIYAIATVYDGFLSMVCQPFMAIGISAVITFIALIFGLPLMLLTPYRPQWLAIIVVGISLLTGFSFLFIPGTFTFIFQWIYPAIQDEVISPAFLPVLGYFIVIFSIVNWPKIRFIKPRKDTFSE